MSRIFIAGYFGFHNAGDEAILAASLHQLRQDQSDVEFRVTSATPAATASTHGVAAVAWQDIPAIESATRWADLVVIGGGGLFHDYWPSEPKDMLSRFHGGLSYLGSVARLASLLGRPLIAHAVGIGPLNTDAGRAHTRAVLEQCWAVTVRDPQSCELALGLGVDPDRVHVTADPAFLLEPAPSARARELLAREQVPDGVPLLGVALRSWEFAGDARRWMGEIARAVDAWATSHRGHALLVPFQRHEEQSGTDDCVVSDELVSLMNRPESASVLRGVVRPDDLLAVFGACQGVVGMRLHSVIFAARAGVPPVAVAYDPKVSSAMAQLHLEELCLPLAEISSTALVHLLDLSQSASDRLSAPLAGTIKDLTNRCGRDLELVRLALAGQLNPPPAPSPATRELLDRSVIDLALRADSTYDNNLAMAQDRRNVIKERDRLSGQKDLLTAERDAARRQAAESDREAAALRRQVEDLRDQCARRVESLAAELAEERQALQAAHEELSVRCRESEGLRTRITRLESENATLAWKARGVLGRAADRLFRPRPEGHLTYWARSVYYAGARLIRRFFGSAAALPPGGAPSRLYADTFRRYAAARDRGHARNLAGMRCPSTPGLASIVLPVFNGESLIAEAVESVLAQTYRELELIIIDDGSTDGTAGIVDAIASRDPRVRVIHQENQKLPRALSAGFRMAGGQFVTWTSHDNRLKPFFLERLVDCLNRHPDWDMVYANMDIIGDDGHPLVDSHWYYGYQNPRGSNHIHLPATTDELNTWANNSIGGAFLLRDRVAALLGDYCPDRFTIEDYDYWMQVNEFLTVRHADFDETVYEYRFHDNSLTTQEDDSWMLALREKVMAFDDFRRDFALTPIVWILDGEPKTPAARRLVEELRKRIELAGHTLASPEGEPLSQLPGLFVPTVYVRWEEDPGTITRPPADLPEHALAVVLADGKAGLPDRLDPAWSCGVAVGAEARLTATAEPYQGWFGISDAATLFTALDVRVRTDHFRAIEAAARAAERSDLEASVVISTLRRPKPLEAAIRSLAAQTTGLERFEVVVVNNDPEDDLTPLIDELRAGPFSAHPCHLRLVTCPLPGLSPARNVGIGASKGDIVAVLDDDALATERWLEELLAGYELEPEVGVVGGRIKLSVPEAAPEWLTEEAWPLWGHLDPGFEEPRVAETWDAFPWGGNWSARRKLLLEIGGFRCGYGRNGDDYGGGEEIVAAALAQRAGAKVVLQPRAIVYHQPDAGRFTREYVAKTIRAGTFVSYQLQRDLYIQPWLRPLDLLEQILKRLGAIVGRRSVSPFRKLERACRLRADAALFRRMVLDSLGSAGTGGRRTAGR